MAKHRSRTKKTRRTVEKRRLQRNRRTKLSKRRKRTKYGGMRISDLIHHEPEPLPEPVPEPVPECPKPLTLRPESWSSSEDSGRLSRGLSQNKFDSEAAKQRHYEILRDIAKENMMKRRIRNTKSPSDDLSYEFENPEYETYVDYNSYLPNLLWYTRRNNLLRLLGL